MAVSRHSQMAAWRWSVLLARTLGVTSMTSLSRMSRHNWFVVICSLRSLPVVLPVSWKSTMFVGLDACFKLKSKDRSFVDVDLGTGLAYMVNNEKYQRHLAHCLKNPPPKEVRVLPPCSQSYTISDFLLLACCLWFNVTCGERRPHQVVSWVSCYRHYDRIMPSRFSSAQRRRRSSAWRTVRCL